MMNSEKEVKPASVASGNAISPGRVEFDKEK
jgi:hypothetical protein